MKMLSDKVKNKIVDVLFGILLTFSFVYALTSSLNLKFSRLQIVLVLTALFLIYAGIFFNRLSTILSLSLLGCSGVIWTLYTTFSHKWGDILSFAYNYQYWLDEYINYADMPNSLFDSITVIILCIVTALVVYLFAVKHFVYPVLVIIGASIFSVQWMYNFMSTLWPFYLFVFLIILYYLRYVFMKKQAAGKNDYVLHTSLMLWLIPICGVVLLISSILQYSNKPLEWKWLDKKIASISSYWDQRFDYRSFDYFSVASSGFSQNDGELGGRVRLNSTPVLWVKSPRRVYLKGTVKDIYSGSRWEVSNHGAVAPAPPTDTQSSIIPESMFTYLMKGLEADKLPEYCTKDNIIVRFERMKTKSLFVPLDYSAIYEDINFKNTMKGLQTTVNGSLSFEKRKEKGFAYSLSTYTYNYSDKKLISIMRQSSGGLFQTLFNRTRRNNSTIILNNFVSDNLSIEINLAFTQQINNNTTAVRNKYLQLPEQLPQRVKDLSLSLTEKYTNDYDKAKAIESFLSSTFSYTLDTRALPRNRDFVDYFLFDQKKGYCTYYASAMAVMARCAGIPSRYVEGYMLPPTPEKDGYYRVTNMNAHAWVEIYLDGFGWVPFEPTAPFVSTFYSDDTPSAATDTGGSGFFQNDEYMRMMERYRNQNQSDLDMSDLPATENQDNRLLPIIILSVVLTLLLLSFLTLCTVNFIRHRIRISGIAGLTPRESVISAYKYYVGLLQLQRFGIAPGETTFTYSRRVDNNFSFQGVTFKAISKIFTKARYSTLDITDDEKKMVYDFHLMLLRETKSNLGRHKFFFLKNMLGKI